MSDLRDAVTGQLLNGAGGLFRCGTCDVYYQADSVDFLKDENHGACVACGGATILAVGATTSFVRGRNDGIEVTTLAHVRRRVGQIVIFEGRVTEVRTSHSGSSYAALFESGTWADAFKLVFLRRAVTTVGGPAYIRSLSGRTVRVRGLVQRHDLFGYEILVSDRSMILEVAA